MLVVDDDAFIRRPLEFILQQEGFRALLAEARFIMSNPDTNENCDSFRDREHVSLTGDREVFETNYHRTWDRVLRNAKRVAS